MGARCRGAMQLHAIVLRARIDGMQPHDAVHERTTRAEATRVDSHGHAAHGARAQGGALTRTPAAADEWR